ncbi:MAG: hypothetical protein SVT52_06535 [Planctomycetota bacterium]|nr:hypothetical protein [Planctomycetota bacterium]
MFSPHHISQTFIYELAWPCPSSKKIDCTYLAAFGKKNLEQPPAEETIGTPAKKIAKTAKSDKVAHLAVAFKSP